MKSIKSLMVVLTLTMGVFFSSCLSGSDGDNTVTTGSILRYYNTGTFIDSSGYFYYPTGSSYSISGTIGDMYYVYYQYDSSTVTSTSTGVNITLLSTPTCIDGLMVSETEVTSTAALYGIQYSSYVPALFDKNTLVMPILYWYYPAETTAELTAEVRKHTFKLYYVADNIGSNDTTLNLYITHQINETTTLDRTKYTLTYQSYDISNAMEDFDNITGSTPTKIIIHGKVNTTSDVLSSALDDTYTITLSD